MTDQAGATSLLNEVRGLAPGFVVSFVKPHLIGPGEGRQPHALPARQPSGSG